MNHEIEVNRKVTVTKIALTGKMRAGKDEIAHHLFIRYGFTKVAFGDALKRSYHDLFPWVSEFSKPRAGYQKHGQMVRKEFGEDVWIRHVERRIDVIINVNKNDRDHIGIVITDLRQPNEYEWARANGFTIIRVTAPDELRIKRAVRAGDDFTVHDFAHDTEQHVGAFEVDYEINNEGTVEELHAKVDAIMEAIT
jgi:dephospho-CoA kinase